MSVSPQALRLAGLLRADRFRSGEDIAAALGCSRAAVWKQVRALRALGITVQAVPGRGYRLERPLELLDAGRIRAAMRLSARLSGLEVLPAVDSTNLELQRREVERRHGLALLAELQTGGRGRMGRSWHSPFGRNLYLSLGWRFGDGLAALSCLPLVVALAAAAAAARAGAVGVGIKWPNDLVLDGAKLGGCLVEVQGDPQGPCHAVLGVGLNVHMAGAPGAAAIDRAWTDLGQLPGVSRNALAGWLLDALFERLPVFVAEGFAPFRAEWDRHDLLAGREVRLRTAAGEACGTARGIGARGGLLLEVGGVLTEHLAGEASLGAAAIPKPA